MATKSEVETFLKELHEKMHVGQVIFVYRQKNIEAIHNLDLAHADEDRKSVIRSLEVEDYSEGPTPDDFGISPLWVFGKQYKGKEIYIKVQIVKLNTICISFHEAEYQPMDYPFKIKQL